VSFKKTKIPSIDISGTKKSSSSLRQAYELSKKRNIISALLLTALAIFVLSSFAMFSLEKI
jgi:hypothetical protein